MLTPLDIVSLRSALDFNLSQAERDRYLVWWKQFFFDMEWVKSLRQHHCTVTVIGNDLRRLNEALAREHTTLDASQFQFIVVIGEPQSMQVIRSYDHHRYILHSFDSSVAWNEVPSQSSTVAPHIINQQSQKARICLLSIVHNTIADLNYSWSRILSKRGGNLSKFLVGPGHLYNNLHDVWDTEWQPLEDGPYIYKPIHMHYIVKPSVLCTYTMRLFVNAEGICFAIFMRGGHRV